MKHFCTPALLALEIFTLLSAAMPAAAADRLFPENLPALEWIQFQSPGFKGPAAGMIFDAAHPACCGVALGALGTGALDIQTDGVFGFGSMFPAPTRQIPFLQGTKRNPQLLRPFLGISMGGQTWLLATQKYIEGGRLQGCYEPGNALERKFKDNPQSMALWQADLPQIVNIKGVKDIHYWGHYPVADLQYVTDAPLEVAMRAWSPFIPGDAPASNIPGAVFEIHLANTSSQIQKGTLAFSFPGIEGTDPAFDSFKRTEIKKPFEAMMVSTPGGEFSYALAALGAKPVRFGGGLASAPEAWSKIDHDLPSGTAKDSSGSVGVDFDLKAGESQTIRLLLAWYARHFRGGIYEEIKGFDGPWGAGPWKIPRRDRKEGILYTFHYTRNHGDALDVARHLAASHEQLLNRVLAWQEAIYSSPHIPVWLRDCLVNNLNLIAKTSVWASPAAEFEDWSYPHGPFGLNESPRSCSIIGCIASNWYGQIPITYFFPELDRMILRNYKAYMRGDGAIPFLYPTSDFTQPNYEWQIGLNGPCFVDLVDRLWLRLGDDEVLREFYPAVKKATIFTINLVPGPEGIISIPRDGSGQLWWEHTPAYGMVTQYGGVHLAMIKMAERMAKAAGDEEFLKQCQERFKQGSEALEDQMWHGSYYLLYRDPKYRKEGYTPPKNLLNYESTHSEKSELIMASQLDGEWMARFHGLGSVFRADRIPMVLETVRKTCVTPYGFAGFASPLEGAKLEAYGTFAAENHIVAMTYMYHGQADFGLELVRKFMDNVVRRQRHAWDLPNMITCDTGERFFGTDYFQNMMLWCVPAAMEIGDLARVCARGKLVDRVLQAARQR
ncbi:MAG: hypothetical protein HY717_20855 [Planctomycetes bacterium]|nr:hypothetical protein [Planctomycetota bacterium]